MFTEFITDEPLEKIVGDWDFFEDKVLPKFSTFKPVGQNIYGIRRRAISGDQVNDPKKGNISLHYEMGPRGVSTWHHEALNLHITTSGTPHRVSHNFGYWHINDKDELYLPIPGTGEGDDGYFFLVMSHPRPGETDRFAWYCSECLTMLHEYVYETGSAGFSGFWKAEDAAVRGYNADIANRTCPECGHVNPMGYCWNKAKDTAEESAARKLW